MRTGWQETQHESRLEHDLLGLTTSILLTEIKRNTQKDFPILTRTKQGII